MLLHAFYRYICANPLPEMKKLPLLFAAFLVVSASGLRAGEPSDIHTLLRRLDGLLDRREEFLLRHEARLDSLKSLLRGDTLGFGARYAVTAEIAERYFAYQSDSTIAYLRRNVALAERAGVNDKAKELGGSIEIVEYTRFEVGEGVEKKEENFAEEVAKQMGL